MPTDPEVAAQVAYEHETTIRAIAMTGGGAYRAQCSCGWQGQLHSDRDIDAVGKCHADADSHDRDMRAQLKRSREQE